MKLASERTRRIRSDYHQSRSQMIQLSPSHKTLIICHKTNFQATASKIQISSRWLP